MTGSVAVPGDKSISHRYAILAALAEGRSDIQHYSAAADCRSTLEALAGLGAKVEELSGSGVAITGEGLNGLREPSGALDAGNSGTTMRMLPGVLAGQRFDSILTGDGSLTRRPMRRVIEPLARMGARIAARDDKFAPLEIRGSTLHAIAYTLPVASAQVKSAILLAGTVCGRRDKNRGAGSHARSHRTGACRVRRGRGPCGPGGAAAGASQAYSSPADGSGRSVVRHFFSGSGAGAAAVGGAGAKRGLESDARRGARHFVRMASAGEHRGGTQRSRRIGG